MKKCGCLSILLVSFGSYGPQNVQIGLFFTNFYADTSNNLGLLGVLSPNLSERSLCALSENGMVYSVLTDH